MCWCRTIPTWRFRREDGTFEIKNIPAGKHEFQFWHEGSGYLKNLKYKGGTANRQGRADVDDRGRRDARSGRHQSAGKPVEVNWSVVSRKS